MSDVLGIKSPDGLGLYDLVLGIKNPDRWGFT